MVFSPLQYHHLRANHRQLYTHHTPCNIRLPSKLIAKSYMDRVSVYDAHNRVFYIYFLGHYQNQPIFHFGETNDLDATEFFMKSSLPFYELQLYIPIDHEHHAFTHFQDFIQDEIIKFPVHNLEHLDTFSPSRYDIKTILEKVNEIYANHCDLIYDE